MVYTGMIYQLPQTPAPAFGPEQGQPVNPIFSRIRPRGTAPNCEAARIAAGRAGMAWQTLDTQAQNANRNTAATLEQAKRDVDVFGEFSRALAAAADQTLAAVQLLPDVDDALAKADLLITEAQRILKIAQEENSLEAVEIARQYNDAGRALANVAGAALDNFQAAFDSFELAKRSIDGLAARTHASIEAAGAEETRANFQELLQIAKKATDDTDDALSRFAKAISGILILGFAAIVGLAVWQFARR